MTPLQTSVSYNWYRSWGKRTMDIIISSLALLVLWPIMVVVGIFIRISIGSPVLFVQPRPGFNERIFRMLKFRSMTDARSSDGRLLPDDERVTWLGKVLRAASLDELPELCNVLRGEMSLVGPRPLLVEYLPHYSTEQNRRHTVRPGITGLAQINGRNQTTWDERLAWDTHYVDNCSLSLDCRILAGTVVAIFRSDGGIEAIEALGRFNERHQRAHDGGGLRGPKL
jgi:lipopolysaccharide/colanic/teichoic acid biosynthesis glycosyltransferase